MERSKNQAFLNLSAVAASLHSSSEKASLRAKNLQTVEVPCQYRADLRRKSRKAELFEGMLILMEVPSSNLSAVQVLKSRLENGVCLTSE